jgi:hypothetical protein
MQKTLALDTALLHLSDTALLRVLEPQAVEEEKK